MFPNGGIFMVCENTLTEGNVSKKFLRFFFPMLLTNLLQQLYQVADTIIVGKGLGDNSLAAVGNFSSFSFLTIGFIMGFSGGFSVIIGQDYGSADIDKVKRSIAHAIKLTLQIGLLLSVIGLLLIKPVLIAIKTDKAIIDECFTYGVFIFGGLIVTSFYNLLSGILRALGDSKTPFIAILISSVANIILDIIFIFMLRTGVEGPAIATVISQLISALICLLKLNSQKLFPGLTLKFAYQRQLCISLLENGISMGFMNSITAIGSMVVQSYVNRYGVTYTAAYSVCIRYLNLFMLPSLTAGFAISAFVSQNFGAGKFSRIQKCTIVGVKIAFVSYLCLGALMVLLPRQLSLLMISGNDAVMLSSDFIRVCGFGLILLNLLFIYRSAIQGMGRPVVPTISGITEMLLRISVIAVFVQILGFKATAYAECIAWFGAFSICYFTYKNKIQKD